MFSQMTGETMSEWNAGVQVDRKTQAVAPHLVAFLFLNHAWWVVQDIEAACEKHGFDASVFGVCANHKEIIETVQASLAMNNNMKAQQLLGLLVSFFRCEGTNAQVAKSGGFLMRAAYVWCVTQNRRLCSLSIMVESEWFDLVEHNGLSWDSIDLEENKEQMFGLQPYPLNSPTPVHLCRMQESSADLSDRQETETMCDSLMKWVKLNWDTGEEASATFVKYSRRHFLFPGSKRSTTKPYPGREAVVEFPEDSAYHEKAIGRIWGGTRARLIGAAANAPIDRHIECLDQMDLGEIDNQWDEPVEMRDGEDEDGPVNAEEIVEADRKTVQRVPGSIRRNFAQLAIVTIFATYFRSLVGVHFNSFRPLADSAHHVHELMIRADRFCAEEYHTTKADHSLTNAQRARKRIRGIQTRITPLPLIVTHSPHMSDRFVFRLVVSLDGGDRMVWKEYTDLQQALAAWLVYVRDSPLHKGCVESGHSIQPILDDIERYSKTAEQRMEEESGDLDADESGWTLNMWI